MLGQQDPDSESLPEASYLGALNVVLRCLGQKCLFPEGEVDVFFCFCLQIEYERKKKEDGKRARADKQHVLDMLFSAFEKHQYYNLKDLVDITKQPVVRICLY